MAKEMEISTALWALLLGKDFAWWPNVWKTWKCRWILQLSEKC